METYDPDFMEKQKKLLKTAKRVAGIFIVVVVLAVLSTGSFYNIGEQEQAVLTTFGVAKSVTEP